MHIPRQASASDFFTRGWLRFDADPQIAAWVRTAAPLATQLAEDRENAAKWLRCGGTWFAGVNIFPNGPDGSVPTHQVPPLAGQPVQFIHQHLGLGPLSWDKAQISVCYPGYPQPWQGETEAAFRYRRDRDAAHVDGLVRQMPGRRRSLGEPHGFILGLPLGRAPRDAAPLVVWEASHEVMRVAFQARLGAIAPCDWPDEDITDVYTAARRQVFETCRRVVLHAEPGETYLVHRLALHGVAPWGTNAGTAPRAIAYFRPEISPRATPERWLADR